MEEGKWLKFFEQDSNICTDSFILVKVEHNRSRSVGQSVRLLVGCGRVLAGNPGPDVDPETGPLGGRRPESGRTRGTLFGNKMAKTTNRYNLPYFMGALWQ